MTVLAIHGGGDWYDASANYYDIKEGVTIAQIEDAKKQHVYSKHGVLAEYLQSLGLIAEFSDNIEIIEEY